ncbi:2'-5' RNA ligase family protein [Nonomuraea sp. NPDC001636]|uniref:2'-5' RNA ligase family protein n=1 Tax=Nonomuraea sp. NPDC001636 TaxID=3154391 RepID=UPI0033264E78
MRSRLDAAAADGVPAHVTILYPFLDRDRLDEVALGRLIAAHAAFDVRFAGCGRFPGVLYLAPGPERPFRELTEAVAARWPEAPPYEGRFASIVPHLTVADRQEPAAKVRQPKDDHASLAAFSRLEAGRDMTAETAVPRAACEQRQSRGLWHLR